jgi:hypothetical protein
MFGIKDLIFYSVAGTVIGTIAEVAGASLAVVILTALLIPPVLLLIYRMLK